MGIQTRRMKNIQTRSKTQKIFNFKKNNKETNENISKNALNFRKLNAICYEKTIKKNILNDSYNDKIKKNCLYKKENNIDFLNRLIKLKYAQKGCNIIVLDAPSIQTSRLLIKNDIHNIFVPNDSKYGEKMEKDSLKRGFPFVYNMSFEKLINSLNFKIKIKNTCGVYYDSCGWFSTENSYNPKEDFLNLFSKIKINKWVLCMTFSINRLPKYLKDENSFGTIINWIQHHSKKYGWDAKLKLAKEYCSPTTMRYLAFEMIKK